MADSNTARDEPVVYKNRSAQPAGTPQSAARIARPTDQGQQKNPAVRILEAAGPEQRRGR